MKRTKLADPWPRRCEVGVPSVCTGRAQHKHHRVLRSRGGSDDFGNLVHCCHACHAHIHANPAWATAHGFMSRRSA